MTKERDGKCTPPMGWLMDGRCGAVTFALIVLIEVALRPVHTPAGGAGDG